MIQFKTILKAARPFLGGVTITVDRMRQQIIFSRNGDKTILTVNQLLNQIEETFTKVKNVQPRGEMPGKSSQEPIRGSWLADNGQKISQLFNN